MRATAGLSLRAVGWAPAARTPPARFYHHSRDDMAEPRPIPKGDPVIVDVQGIGPVEFPPGTSGAQIQSWVMGKLREAGVPPQSWGDYLGNMAGRVGGGIAGGLLGSLAGPVGTFAGTATGAALGEEWAQHREVKQGVRDNVNPVSIAAAGATAPIPGATMGAGPLLRQVPRAFAAGLPASAAGSAAMQYAEGGTVDPWQTGRDAVKGATLGTLMGVGAPAATRAAQSKAAQKLVRDETGAIRVYHGSPHDFDQFSTEKIGTGEGAQAYGHGLYFAEQEGTAKVYRDALGGDAIEFPDRGTQMFQRETPEGTAQFLLNAVSTSDRDVAATYQAARRELYEEIGRGLGKNNGRYERNLEALKVLDQWQQIGAKPGRAGKMYEVNINADPEQFLDWDKPVTMQSPQVQEALAKYGVKPPERDVIQEAEDQLADYWKEYDAALRKNDKGRIDIFERAIRQAGFDLETLKKAADMTGATAYREAGQADTIASQRLREAGVPGIKYLDQGSRLSAGGELIDVSKGPDGWKSKIRVNRPDGTNGFTWSAPHPTREAAERWAQEKIAAGTRNYVVFDDKLVSILRKYGLLPLGQVGSPQTDEREKR